MSLNWTETEENENSTSNIFSILSDFCTRPLKLNQRPSFAETLLPPLVLFVVMVAGTFALSISTYLHSKKLKKRLKYMQKCKYPEDCSNRTDEKIMKNNNTSVKEKSVVDSVLEGDSFYNPCDSEILQSMQCYYNQPKRLAQICLPAFISLLLTATITFLFPPISSCLWPARGRPDINTAITCFLSPAGLVYALSFGFTFQMVLEKHRRILKKITSELSMIDQIATMTEKMNLPTSRHEMAIYKAVKSEAMFLAMLVQKREPSSFQNKVPRSIKVHVWTTIDILKDATELPETKFNLNRILVDKVIDYLLQLNNICADKMGSLHATIHPMKWLFLEVLGGLVLLGILLINAESSQMELTMCELTIFSISMLCYVLADLDSPFNGFFRVDISVLPQVLNKLEILYNEAQAKSNLTKVSEEIFIVRSA